MVRNLTSRAAVAAAALAVALGGCTRSTDFSITRHYDDVALMASQVSGTQHVDLAADAGGAWSERSHVKSLELVGLDATVTRVASGGGTLVSGAVSLSRAGLAPVKIGAWSEVIPATVPHTLSATLNPAGEAILNDAIRSDGQFDVEFAVSSAGAIVFDTDVTMHLHMTYRVP